MNIKHLNWAQYRQIARQRAADGVENSNYWHHASIRWPNLSQNWYGTPSLEAALELADKGWPDGTAQIMRGVHSEQDFALPHIIPLKHYDVGGEYPDVGAYCAGEPENMVTIEQGKADIKPVVKIAFSGGMAQEVTGEQVINYGVGALSLVNAILASGRSVEIHWCGFWDSHYFLDVLICEADSPLDIDRLAFVLAHPSMNRRLGYAVKESFPDWNGLGRSHGSTSPLPANQLPGFILFPSIPAMRGVLNSRTHSLEYLKNFVAKSVSL